MILIDIPVKLKIYVYKWDEEYLISDSGREKMIGRRKLFVRKTQNYMAAESLWRHSVELLELTQAIS